MKKLSFAVVAALMLLTVACNRVKPVFELTSEALISAPYEGGSYTITYKLVSEENNVIKAITDNKEMITTIDTQAEDCIRIQVSANPTTEIREATIIVSYGTMCFNVDVEQAAKTQEPENPEQPEEPENPNDPEQPNDPEEPDTPEEPEEPEQPEEPTDYIINVNANQLVGNYYGSENLVSGLGHYWIIFSDGGIVDGVATPNSEYFRLDLLGPTPADENDIRIPDGIYTLDIENDFNNFSILKLGNTDYLYIDNAGESWATPFTYAELDVEGNSMYLMAVVEDKEYHVTFNSDYTLSYNTLSEHISTLTSDHEIDLSNCSGSVKCFGDYWSCGYSNWQIEFLCNDGLNYGTYLVLDFITDDKLNGTSGFEGTFHSSGFTEEDPTKPAFGPYTFVPGFRVSEVDNYMMGSVLVEYIDGTAVEQAPIFGGEFTITANGDGTHTIIIKATDDANPTHKITLNWTGTLK